MEPLEPDDPRQVGTYRLLRQLGAGGMGRVYLGRSAGGRTVAVKVVRRELAKDAQFRARFRQEVTAARRVGGAWTAPVLDADTEGAEPWVATGYVAGPALGAAVRGSGPLPEPAVRALGVGLAEALAHVHGLGLVHRDVKPSNVLLALDGPRLIDFGITRALDATSELTDTGHVIGSPGFMSPEQAQGLAVGPASDVFTLGSVLAFAATGVPPFGEGVSGAVLLYRVLHEEPELSALEGPLRSIVVNCLAKNPAARPTPRQLRDRLDPDGTAAARLSRGGWLPSALAAAVGRSAVELLELETDGGTVHGASASPVPTRSVPPPPAPPQSAPPQSGFGPPAAPVPPPAHVVPTVTARTPPTPAPGPIPGSRPGPRPGPIPGPGLPTAPWPGATAPVPSAHMPSAHVPSAHVPSAPWYPGPGGPGVAVLGTVPGPPAPAPAPRKRRYGCAFVGGAVAAVLLIGLVAYGIDQLGGSDASDGTTSAAGAGAVTRVPAAFVGVWTGEVRPEGGGTSLRLALTISAGAVGDEAGKNRLDDTTGWCESAWRLAAASDKQLQFTSRVLRTGGTITCSPSADARILTLQADGTIRFTSQNGTFISTLRKVR
ncbi:serine/threonine-protein kinase [Kitasatospora sp. NPDC093806]|uniref:serine/threonine-protein kinase n=1 Tax=Kitasatospora sp. NPDC093806 TaxID=3155075 RepID=UPI003429C7D8